MVKQHVYITRLIPKEGIDLLKCQCIVEVNPHDRPLSREELFNAVKGKVGVLCLLTDRIDDEIMDAATGIKGFANYAVGYDNIDVKQATQRGIPVSNTPDVLTDATSEMAWALLFTVARRVVESDRQMRTGTWQGWGPMQFIGGDISGKTLGIAGAGRIGTAMALKSRGFNMSVVYTGNARNEVLESTLDARKVSFEELIGVSDYISVHVPLTEATRHMFNMDVFKKMKKSAYLINTARGPVVNEADLVEALGQGLIAGAGLDVYEFEPKTAHGLAGLDNVVCTAHTASATRETRANMAIKAAKNLLAMINGGQAPDCINPEVYEIQRS